jgi:hypothetical protein
MVFHPKSVICWPRFVSQGLNINMPKSSIGIIMGFPTTLSMNLVGFQKKLFYIVVVV